MKTISTLLVCAITFYTLVVPSLLYAAGINEPATVFYGQVKGTGSSVPFSIYKGDLVFKIRCVDGRIVEEKASLYKVAEGVSYRIDIPHEAVALNLSVGKNSVPLAPSEQTNTITQVLLDGEPCTLLGPTGSTFTTEQLTRSSTFRLDLGITRTATDMDGDGIADWWEDAYGLDKQVGTDANTVLAGGLTYRDCYEMGLDPTLDLAIPQLFVESHVVYAQGKTAILPHIFDVDTEASGIDIRFTQLPLGGTLNFWDETQDQAIAITTDQTLSLADCFAGKIVYTRELADAVPGVIELVLTDGVHTSEPFELQLISFEPTLSDDVAHISDAEQRQRDNYGYAVAGFTILDASAFEHDLTLGLAGLPERRVYVASPVATTTLHGGEADDVFFMGTLRTQTMGGAGADTFVITPTSIDAMTDEGNATLTIGDFNPAEGDVIDLTRLPIPEGANVQDTLALTVTNDGVSLTIDPTGTGSTAMITLDLPLIADADILDWVTSKAINTVDLTVQTVVSIEATQPNATRNGPTPAVVTFSRKGTLNEMLTVPFKVLGVANDGTNIAYIEESISFPQGIAEVTLDIVPSKGVKNEAIVTLVLATSDIYTLDAKSAAVTISALKPVVSLELEPYVADHYAIVEGLTPAFFYVSREDVIDTDLDVMLSFSGTARQGVDYVTPDYDIEGGRTPEYYALNRGRLTFESNEMGAYLRIMPTEHADVNAGAKTVIATILSMTNHAYIVGEQNQAMIPIINREETFDSWLARVSLSPQSVEARTTNGVDTFSETDQFKFYAFGGESLGDTSGFPSATFENGRMIVRFKKSLGREVTYDVQGMTDLSDATSIATLKYREDLSDVEVDAYEFVEDSPSGFITVDVKKK